MRWTDIPTWTVDVSRSIMAAVRVKDSDTHDHCVRVSRGSRILAKAAGLDEYEQKLVEFAGLFHDIGKVGIPDEILLKPGKLTESEFNVMKSHPEMSCQILKPLDAVEFYKRLMPSVLHHHERYDGRGYPEGVMGEEIPLHARMILIADTYDAMTHTRSYRKGLPAEVAYKELKDFAGRQFDPRLVKIFLDVHPIERDKDQKMFEEMNRTVLNKSA